MELWNVSPGGSVVSEDVQVYICIMSAKDSDDGDRKHNRGHTHLLGCFDTRRYYSGIPDSGEEEIHILWLAIGNS